MHRAFSLLLLLSPPLAAAEGVQIERAGGEARFSLKSAEVKDLSGIAWMGGSSFAAVSDKRNIIQYLSLTVNPATGAIASGSFAGVGVVPGNSGDFEGLARVGKAFYLSTESGPSVFKFDPATRSSHRLSLPAIFAAARPNLSLESLTWNEGVRQFWTGNEEALFPDGPVSSAAKGTLVRLQQLDANFRPLAQYAWRTEPATFRYANAGSGVSDLCLLSNGELIVLERGFTRSGLRLRLFLADFTKAADTSRLPRLADANPVLARKTLLYGESTGFTNFEGLALGAPLANGWRSLILVADSNGGDTHTFLAMKIRFSISKRR